MSWLARTTGSGANSGSEANLADDRSTQAYIVDSTELTAVSASNVRSGDMWHGVARIIAEAARTVNVDYTDDVMEWATSGGATCNDTLETWGPFKKVEVISNGSTNARVFRNDSGVVATQNNVVIAFYEVGTSGKVKFDIRPTGFTKSEITGTGPGTLTVSSEGDGTTAILYDQAVAGNKSVVVYSYISDNTTTVAFTIGPNTSTVGEYVYAYGESFILNQAYPFTHVSTTDATNVTYNADALHYANGGWMAGKDFVFIDQYRSDCIPADLVETLLDLDNGTTQLTADATNFQFTDGTNTATVAHSGIYAADTDIDVMVVRIGASMAVGIAPSGGSVTWSTTQSYVEPAPYHTKLYIAPTQVAPQYIGLTGIYDADEFATIGDAKTWVEGQVADGWPAPAGGFRKLARRQLMGTHMRRRI